MDETNDNPTGTEGNEEEETPEEIELREKAEADAEAEKEKGDGETFELPEKFKGKDAQAIAKSYVELEKSIEKKASQRARDLIELQEQTAQDKKNKETNKEDENQDWVKNALTGVDFSKMKPEDFAVFMLNTIETRAQEIARVTYDTADTTKAQVQQDIEQVTKEWPQLKDNEGFRDMVLTLIENSATKGDALPLVDACKKVAGAMGIKQGEVKEEKKVEKKDDRTGVEHSTGSGTGGKEQTEEEKIIAGLVQGSGTKGGLGDLY